MLAALHVGYRHVKQSADHRIMQAARFSATKINAQRLPSPAAKRSGKQNTPEDYPQ